MDPRNSVFLDTSYLCSLYNSADSNYSLAQTISQTLTNPQVQLVISNYIFLETVTVISQRTSKKFGIRIGNRLQKTPQITNIHINANLHQQTWKVFTKAEDKNLSFVDASIIATMLAEGIKHLITFDQHLATIARSHRLKVN